MYQTQVFIFRLDHHIFERIHLLLGLLSLAGLSTTGLLGGGILLGLLGATDGADTGNGLLAKVSTVAVLGSLVGNTLVDLAGGSVGAVVDGDEVLAGLVGVAGLLGGHGDTTVLSTLDTDGLGVGVTGILERVLVNQVQGVPGELGATAGVTANQKRVLVTGDLPDQVVGDVCLSGHCDGILDWNRRDYRGDSRSRIGAE